MRTADSEKLSLETQQQLKEMLSDSKFLAWLVGSLLVWFVSQFFVVGEILDMLLVGAALVLSGAGIFFTLQSLVGAAHLVGQFVEATRTAEDEKDLDAAADILAEYHRDDRHPGADRSDDACDDARDQRGAEGIGQSAAAGKVKRATAVCAKAVAVHGKRVSQRQRAGGDFPHRSEKRYAVLRGLPDLRL